MITTQKSVARLEDEWRCLYNKLLYNILIIKEKKYISGLSLDVREPKLHFNISHV